MNKGVEGDLERGLSASQPIMPINRDAVTGSLPPSPAPVPLPAAPSGLSRMGRGLKQLPASFASGGLAILQQLQQTISQGLRISQPEIDATLAALNASLSAPTPSQVQNSPPPSQKYYRSDV